MSRTRIAVLISCILVLAALAIAFRGSKTPSPSGQRANKSSLGSGHQSIPVITAETRAEAFSVRRRTIGTLESPAVVVIRSRIDSQILEQHVGDGQIVKKGQLMFKLDDRELKAQIARDEATLAKDLAAQAQTQAQLVRTQQLAPKGISTPQQLEQAQAAFAAAQQTAEADRAVLEADRLKLGYATIEAPMDGRLGTIRTAPGNLVSPGDTAGIVTITRISELRVSFTLPEADLDALRAAYVRKPPAGVTIFTDTSAGKPAATGSLDFVDSQVDQTSGTIAARASIPNPTYALWPGQFVDVEIELSQRPDTVMLPTTAIIMGQQGPYVFVARSDGTVEVRQVKTGGTSGPRTAVLDGLKVGERIIVDGQSRLSPSSHWREAPAASSTATPASAAATTGQR